VSVTGLSSLRGRAGVISQAETVEQLPSVINSLEKLELSGLPIWACAPHPTGVEGMVPREHIETILLAALRDDEFGQPLTPLMVGPAGSGKTTLAKIMAARLQRPFYRFQASDGVQAEDFFTVGRIAPDGTIEYVLQPVAAAAVAGGVVLVDDCEKVPAKALSSLIPLLDGESVLHSLLAGTYLPVHRAFRMLCACNEPAGLPIWFRSRTIEVRVDYPPVEQVMAMASAHLPEATEPLRSHFLDLWRRRSSRAEEPLSPRDAVRILRFAGKLQNARIAPGVAVSHAMAAVLPPA